MSTKLTRSGAPVNRRQHLAGVSDDRQKQQHPRKQEHSVQKSDERQVTDPHPQEEEGYDRNSKVPMTGL